MFSIHDAIRVEPEDPAGLERLGRHLVHPPIVQERLDYHGPSAPGTYCGRQPRLATAGPDCDTILYPSATGRRIRLRSEPPADFTAFLAGLRPRD